jgi:hypothetical protein
VTDRGTDPRAQPGFDGPRFPDEPLSQSKGLLPETKPAPPPRPPLQTREAPRECRRSPEAAHRLPILLRLSRRPGRVAEQVRSSGGSPTNRMVRAPGKRTGSARLPPSRLPDRPPGHFYSHW